MKINNKLFKNIFHSFFSKNNFILIPLLIFFGILLIYKNIYPNPRNWYDHYLYLSKSLIHGCVDIPDLPVFYHDKLEFNGKTYIPFPPGASLVLIPFILLKESITQQQVSILIGSLDILLIYLLLLNFTNKKNAIILSIFLGLGTSFFWSAVVGTTWFFAHVVSIFFITISLILHFNKKHFLSGIFFALAALTRIPMVLAGIFYLLQLLKRKKDFIYFLIGAFIFIPILFFYNWARFGNFLKTGYNEVYLQYANSNYPYTIRQIINPKSTLYGYFDIKNIPMHLYTFFIMPPDINISGRIVKEIKPSPFGMGILFTSPLLFIALKPKFKKGLELNSIITALIVAVPSFLHIMQGWVQFGYRFVLDYVVLLMIILALRFKPTKLNLLLILISIIVNFWGVIWAINLG